ncbi:hypothetical protein [Rhodovulum sp. FJ3]|uniref:hypothetical protein n=1 Tax=Rhodovulum sp. FJ3 TaxID=3079053 RepID=UPI00293DC84C|nr:hypothetical protein [Rhodovulum sp. FJ3]MDV4167819.1 hypothetical protein [Rhodovulum sp. FJ3]
MPDLVLAAAQDGFHSAVPPKWKKSRSQKVGGKYYRPDTSAGHYLMEWFEDLGQCARPYPGTLQPLPETEIAAYFQNRSITPEPWEAATIKAMSCAYVNAWAHGLEEFALSPAEMQNGSD